MYLFKKLYQIVLLLAVIVSGCNLKERSKVEENTTATGEITITADDALKPIVDAEVNTFQAIYQNAKINVIYSSESETIGKLLNSEVKLAIASRPLTKEEVDAYKAKHTIGPKIIKIGIDALAFIINRDNPDSAISYEQIQSMLRGELTNWGQINKQSSLGNINIIFANDSSASVRYLKDSVAKVEKLPPNCFAVNTNPKVIDYVAQNKNSIGVIGVSWVSDRDDTVTRGFLDKVNVLAISKLGNSDYADEYYQPYQGYIANGEYPFNRGIYIINAETGLRLGSGFTAFVAGDKGQRVILKSGLVPATMPVRLVEIKKNTE
ncbi:MAG TPA: substrate-binding domain-containing protein [Cytophagales bacterium]|nr:substrate-binding domain-containing protein [Cytophagales bacterium]